jgi:alpha 1,2-mannosyltransferase
MKENAVILILCRNEEADSITSSINDFENTFNKKYGYPYVFLNDVEWTEEFKEKVSRVVSTKIEFGTLTNEQWGPPPWIDMNRANIEMKKLEEQNIIYGGSLSYRNMCRFFSGHFYNHQLVKQYDYYWRIEPDVNFFCKMNYDPFKYMKDNNKQYGFIISVKEYMETIPSLWKTTLEFLEKKRNILTNNEILSFILDDKKIYNGCHFWSNFEIGNLNFFRSNIYEEYFKYLDQQGGFYYERWGDAPVHSIAASLFLGKEGIHYFEDIGYRHSVYQHCPTSPSRLVDCNCDPKQNIDFQFMSCLKEYIKEIM